VRLAPLVATNNTTGELNPKVADERASRIQIVVDCVIDGAAVRRLHPSRCDCAVCTHRRGWRMKRDGIAAAGFREADPFSSTEWSR
jgi:hypothetical protein